MKLYSFLSVAMFFFVLGLSSCDSGSSVKDAARESLGEVTPPPADAAPANNTPKPAEPPQNAQGVWHYTCSNGCAGGAGAASPCATCGSTLVHNSAYHNTGAPTTAPGAASATPAASVDPTTVIPPKPAEPAQNTKGVWHYTCSNGCAGGAGAAGPCGTCGGTLAHNTAYHN